MNDSRTELYQYDDGDDDSELLPSDTPRKALGAAGLLVVVGILVATLSASLGRSAGIVALLAAIIACLWILPAMVVAKYAEGKGRTFPSFLLLGLAFSWIVSGFVALVIDDKHQLTPEVQPSNRTTGSQAQSDDRVASLERLAALHASGALTDDEFSLEKARLMND